MLKGIYCIQPHQSHPTISRCVNNSIRLQVCLYGRLTSVSHCWCRKRAHSMRQSKSTPSCMIASCFSKCLSHHLLNFRVGKRRCSHLCCSNSMRAVLQPHTLSLSRAFLSGGEQAMKRSFHRIGKKLPNALLPFHQMVMPVVQLIPFTQL